LSDACDPSDDDDTVLDMADNRPRAANPDQADGGADGPATSATLLTQRRPLRTPRVLRRWPHQQRAAPTLRPPEPAALPRRHPAGQAGTTVLSTAVTWNARAYPGRVGPCICSIAGLPPLVPGRAGVHAEPAATTFIGRADVSLPLASGIMAAKRRVAEPAGSGRVSATGQPKGGAATATISAEFSVLHAGPPLKDGFTCPATRTLRNRPAQRTILWFCW
jgi:hypothetical protein